MLGLKLIINFKKEPLSIINVLTVVLLFISLGREFTEGSEWKPGLFHFLGRSV